MKKPNRILLFLVLAVLLAAAGFAGYVFFKPHRSVSRAEALTITADSLYRAYQQDEAAANARYLDKALEVTGRIASVQTNQQGQKVIVLDAGDPMGGIACTLSDKAAELPAGQEVRIRGFCSGFVADVVIRDAILIP